MKNNIKILSVVASLVLSVVMLAGCGNTQETSLIVESSQQPIVTEMEETVKAEYHKISAKEAQDMIDSGNVTIVDVRTLEEYNSGHIKDAILLTNTDISAKAEEVLPDKSATVLVYCRSGNRSQGASQELVRLGYTAVYDFGGILDWPGEVVK